MIGPVLHQELLLGSRRTRLVLFRRLYAGWLVLQLCLFWFIYLVTSNQIGNQLYGTGIDPDAAPVFVVTFLRLVVVQQLLVTLLATPAFTAGAITDEKARGTLQHLLTADLTSAEIILGKLLGRSSQVLLLVLAGLPMVALVAGYGGLNPVVLLAVMAVTLPPLFALGAVSLLASVWSRQTRDAVVGVYFLGLAALLLLGLTGNLDFFNPLYVLEPAWSGHDVAELGRRLLLFLLAWGGSGGLCLVVAAWRLRRAYLRQLEGLGRPKRTRWWRAAAATVSDEPIRWKERHVEGLAPLAALRRVPRWLGVLLVFAATLTSSWGLLLAQKPADLTAAELLTQLAAQNAALPDLAEVFWAQGLVAMLVASLVVGIRCSGAVTSEREGQTWEALLLTPLPVRQLIRGKLWGIIGASYPYLAAYAVPAAVVALLLDLRAFFWVVLGVVLTWLAMWFVGAAGLWSSVHARSSWRSLLTTLGFGYVGGFLLYCVALPFIGVAYVLLLATFLLIDYAFQTDVAGNFVMSANIFFLGSDLALVATFVGAAWYFLRAAETYVADRERVRHWHEEPVRNRTRHTAARARPPRQPRARRPSAGTL
jgi:ABC-type transport system involved in multi-copper enzyme maturation permease subunit